MSNDRQFADLYFPNGQVKPEAKRVFVVTMPSAISARDCFLASGPTKAAAMEDAIGPKPWTAYQKRLARKADVREMSAAEADAMEAGSAYEAGEGSGKPY